MAKGWANRPTGCVSYVTKIVDKWPIAPLQCAWLFS